MSSFTFYVPKCMHYHHCEVIVTFFTCTQKHSLCKCNLAIFRQCSVTLSSKNFWNFVYLLLSSKKKKVDISSTTSNQDIFQITVAFYIVAFLTAFPMKLCKSLLILTILIKLQNDGRGLEHGNHFFSIKSR